VVAPNICGYSVQYMLNMTYLAPTILKWLLDFRKFVDPCPEEPQLLNKAT